MDKKNKRGVASASLVTTDFNPLCQSPNVARTRGLFALLNEIKSVVIKCAVRYADFYAMWLL